ncbi:hypothetical protein [Schaalia suimastitidis]|uniref:hypothetical protein n=1 Tax=Schaalia suimastitidis TaxID=121163 RepID=UPI001040A721|nr:hypothetical protein [Schaalia suimastitidis]
MIARTSGEPIRQIAQYFQITASYVRRSDYVAEQAEHLSAVAASQICWVACPQTLQPRPRT